MTTERTGLLPASLRVQAARASTVGFIAGFISFFRGARLVYISHRELSRIYVAPMILAAVLVVGAWITLFTFANNIVNWVWTEPALSAWGGFKHVLWHAAAVLLWILLAVAAAASSVIVFSLTAAPFSDYLSEQVESILGTWTARELSVALIFNDLSQTLRLELGRLGLKARWLIPLFFLSCLIPVLGHLLYIGIGGYWLAKYTGMDYVDWCAARRGWSWKQRVLFAQRHRFPLAGLGTAIVLSCFVPLLFVFAWPAAVAGGALLFTDLLRWEGAGTLSTMPSDDKTFRDE